MPDDSKISAISESGYDFCFASSNNDFFALICLVVFPWYTDIVHWIKGTTVSRLLVMWWKRMREEAFYLPMIVSQSFSEPVSLNCEVHNS